MLKKTLGLATCFALSATVCAAQTRSPAPSGPALSPKWEDLSSAEFVKAVQKADGVCMLPMGSVESFGPTAPLGTNVYLAKIISLEAARQDYAVIFPDYFVANTTNTSHLAGAIRYSQKMQLEFLDETTHEMARNGCRKIILANGHTGNLPIINLYMGNFAAEPHDYAVYTYYVSGFPVGDPNQLPPAARVSAPGKDGHGGEERVAALMAYYPELIHLERSHDEAFEPGHGAEDRTNPPPAGAMREIPTGYSGDAAGATAARGHALVDFQVARVVKFIGAVKADKATLGVQKEFYQRLQKPQAPPLAKK